MQEFQINDENEHISYIDIGGEKKSNGTITKYTNEIQ